LQKKNAAGGELPFFVLWAFLRGVLGKVGGWTWFSDGKNVVNAWWIVVS
jgi:hypothetical protein